jgi:hypothetical protein
MAFRQKVTAQTVRDPVGINPIVLLFGRCDSRAALEDVPPSPVLLAELNGRTPSQ